MSNTLATVQKNLQGFGAGKSACGPSCDNTRLVCLTVGNKNYLVEVDSCGNQVTDAKPLGTCSVRPDGTSFPLDENGNQIIDINEIDMDINSVALNGSALNFTSEDDSVVTVDICAIVAANCNSPMVVNADGSVTYTDNAGVVTTIPAPVHSSLVVNADGSLTHTSGDGVVTEVPAQTVSALAVAGSVVSHDDGKGNVVTFDICAIVAANCNSPMVLNADGSVVYTDNAGTVTTIPAPVHSSLVADVAAGTFTHTSGDGVNTVVDVCALAQICAPSLVAGPGANQYTFNNGYGVTSIIDVNEIDMDINSMTVAGSVVNFSAEDGKAGSFDICAIVAANCNSPMTLNADGSVSYTDNAGVTTVIPAPVYSSISQSAGVITHKSGDGNEAQIDICGIVSNNCDSQLQVNSDNSVTHTSNSGVATTFCRPSEYVGEIICDEDANGVSCLGVTTHVIYDGATCQPIRKVSHCTDDQVVQAVAGINGSAVYGNFNVLDPAQISAGDIIEFTSELNFTLQKVQDVSFEALWSLTGRNARMLVVFEFDLDGTGWQPCSGGSNDDLVFPAYGTPGEIYSPEQCALRNLSKGAHNMKFRLRVVFDSNESTPLGDPYIVRFLNAAHFKVSYSRDVCLEVNL